MRKKPVSAVLALPALIAVALIAVFGKRMLGVIRISFLALLIAYLLEPMVSSLEKRMGRTLSMICVYFALVACVSLLAFLVVLPALNEIKNLSAYFAGAMNGLGALMNEAQAALEDKNLPLQMPEIGNLVPAEDAGKLVSYVLSAAGSAAGFFANAMAAIALSWFFLADWSRLSIRLFLMVPSGIRPKVINAVMSVRRDLGGYVRAQLFLILIVGALATGALFLTSAPMPVSMGVMYALLNAIPYFGPLIGIIPPVISCLYVSWQSALYTLIALLLVQQIDNYVLSPRIMGAVSGSGPAAVLIAISAGGALFGVAGMFLALPVFISCKSVYRIFTAPAV